MLNGGEDTDPNAISFATGYNKVVWGQAAKTVAAGATNSEGMTRWSARTSPPGGPTPRAARSSSRSSPLTRTINATIEANDGLANAVITDLKADGVKPKKIPTTGQDATAQGMAWILEGYQCGSVYKAVYKEAQDAVAMATILLSGDKPPAALLNGTTVDPADSSITEPASLLTPVWVNQANMESTVVKDGFDPASAICAIAGAALCTARPGSRNHLTEEPRRGFMSRSAVPAGRWRACRRQRVRQSPARQRWQDPGAAEPNLGKATDGSSR